MRDGKPQEDPSEEGVAEDYATPSQYAELWRLVDAMLGDTGIVTRLQKQGCGIQYPLPKTVEGFVKILRNATNQLEEK